MQNFSSAVHAFPKFPPKTACCGDSNTPTAKKVTVTCDPNRQTRADQPHHYRHSLPHLPSKAHGLTLTKSCNKCINAMSSPLTRPPHLSRWFVSEVNVIRCQGCRLKRSRLQTRGGDVSRQLVCSCDLSCVVRKRSKVKVILSDLSGPLWPLG